MTIEIPTVMLLGDAMVPLVRAAVALEADDVPPFAVIGGVAVAVRLGRVLRATADLDTVTDYRYEPIALEILKRRDDADYDPADPHTISLAGTQVQFQDVVAVTDADVEHLEPKDLLYVAGHAHALERATLVTISASDRDGPVAATVPVATAGALVAMKLHAYLDRRSTSGPDKRPGDLWDIYNLLLFVAAEAANDLSSAGLLLQNVVASTVERHLVAGAARARTTLRSSNDERYQVITAAEIQHAAGDFVARLHSREYSPSVLSSSCSQRSRPARFPVATEHWTACSPIHAAYGSVTFGVTLRSGIRGHGPVHDDTPQAL